MKKFLVGLAALPFLAGVASAAEPLTNQQMDRVVGGGGLPTILGIGPSGFTIATVGGILNSGAGLPSGFGFPAPPASNPPASNPPAANPPAAATTGGAGNWGTPVGFAASGGTY